MSFLYSQLFIRPSYPTTSFAGQTVIVTGSNTGLGKEAARHIARLGASRLILAVRNTAAGDDAKRDIETTTQCGRDVISVWKLDLSSYASVKAFADKASKELDRIDVLLENAGIASPPWRMPEGHESQITVNVISTFYLALLLLPKLKTTAKTYNVHPRISVVSSEVHGWTEFPEWREEQIFAKLDDEKTARMQERYPTSKLLEVLTIKQLAPKLAGSGVILNMTNPGLCHSELGRNLGWGLYFMKMVLARTTEVGSRTLVAAAAGGEDSHGRYINDALVNDGALSPFVRSQDGEEAARKVWKELSAILEGVQRGVTANM